MVVDVTSAGVRRSHGAAADCSSLPLSVRSRRYFFLAAASSAVEYLLVISRDNEGGRRLAHAQYAACAVTR